MTDFLTTYGVGLIALVVMLESTGLPLPGESLVIAAGMLASSGKLNLVAVLLAAWLGSILGDNLGYVVGRRYGRAAVLRWGDKFGLGENKLAMVEKRFRQYGVMIVLVARFVVILRQLNGFVAGMMHMRWPQFLLYNSISAALWTGAYAGGAYLFGRTLEHFLEDHSTWTILVIAGLVCAAGLFATSRVLFTNKDEAGSPEPSLPHRGNSDGGT